MRDGLNQNDKNKSRKMLFLLFVICVFSWEGVEDMVDFINDNEFGWKAEVNDFSSWSTEKLKKMCSCDLFWHPHHHHVQQYEPKKRYNLPNDFDSRKKWGKCVHPVRNQGECGSCWAHGLTESLSDRFCIGSNGTHDVILAPQDPVSCDPLDQGCNGGIPWVSWEYALHDGIVSEECFPYASGKGYVPKCPKTCKDGGEFKKDKYFAKSKEHVHGVENIMKSIYEDGPTSISMTVYQDFMSYKSGVYQHKTGSYLGGHVIEMVGWGVDGSGKDYWIVKNSWGTTWGIDGYFWILKGKDECGIESGVYAPTPNFDKIPK